MEQKIEQMSVDDAHHADRQRTWVREHYDENARNKYETLEGKLKLIQTIIDSGWIEAAERWKWQSLGISFGDALAQKIGLAWVMVEDDLGRTPSLQLPGSTIILFPLTAISKRIERGESVNVQELFDGFCQTVDQMRTQGY